ncbi:MAG: hypothetical protein GY880_13835 [Planctomycetaceae bacterium]|nr:hypothetical protein [Planctomycetaceae bacterium]
MQQVSWPRTRRVTIEAHNWRSCPEGQDNFLVVYDSSESLPIEQLLSPPAPPIQTVPQLPDSISNANPYDPASNASVWKRIREFFLNGYEE